MTYRSMLFVPGNRPRRVASAIRAGADAVVVDLADAVPPVDRPEARASVATFANDNAAITEMWVRTQNPDHPDFELDLASVVRRGVSGVVVPDISAPDQIHEVGLRIGAHERELGLLEGAIAVAPLLESARAVRSAFEILTASPRVRTAVFAGAVGGDLCNDLGVTPSDAGDELLYARSKVLLDARAAGLTSILDGVWVDLEDNDGLAADSARSRRFGYTGRVAVHPGQLPAIHEAYSPSAAEISDAAELIAAYEAALRNGDGAIRHRGRLADLPMVNRARRVLTDADEFAVASRINEVTEHNG